jgi:AcrR family transcriptional regulator
MATRSSAERILDAAVALVAERGYDGTTVGEIEATAGLTRRAGGFYRHFSSKEEVLVRAVERAAAVGIAELRFDDVVALGSPRAELLLIARAMLHHMKAYRQIRLILWRESHRLPALRAAAHRANRRLAALDVVPWTKSVLKRSGRPGDARKTSLMIFGPIVLYGLSLDRNEPAFGLKDDSFLNSWADHWSGWLAADGTI